jgi:sRNA-binding carbon storage regulator CsrA
MVRLGIEAPERITILREELVGRYDRMKALAEKEERRRNWDKKQGGDA